MHRCCNQSYPLIPRIDADDGGIIRDYPRDPREIITQVREREAPGACKQAIFDFRSGHPKLLETNVLMVQRLPMTSVQSASTVDPRYPL